MNKNDQQFVAQKIRTQYMEKHTSKLDALRSLDLKVRRPANIFSYVFGSISAIIMGSGMSLVMTDIGATLGIANPLVTGIVIGVVGMILAIVNYPMHKGILNSRKKKYAPQIIEMSDKIMKNN
ncbi:MAG: dihydropteridine reductase [Ruminococcaceae bacterium]|nr:dihydropteridine reductase [Oscillospiraceae bacterium]